MKIFFLTIAVILQNILFGQGTFKIIPVLDLKFEIEKKLDFYLDSLLRNRFECIAFDRGKIKDYRICLDNDCFSDLSSQKNENEGEEGYRQVIFSKECSECLGVLLEFTKDSNLVSISSVKVSGSDIKLDVNISGYKYYYLDSKIRSIVHTVQGKEYYGQDGLTIEFDTKGRIVSILDFKKGEVRKVIVPNSK